jgi:Protein of unknown function (DUF3352)
MFKRALSIALFILLVISPAAAQDNLQPENWIPADFAGFLKLNLHSGDTLLGLNMAAFVASFIQPSRFNFEAIQSLDAIIPLTQLDVENASFNTDILPWLGGDILLAYQQFGEDLTVDIDDLLMILPSRDALQSASSFNRILENQDLLERETYREMTLYIADKSTFVFAPQAVIIGQTDTVKAVLDLQNGDGQRLVDTEAYQAIQAASQDNGLVSGYITGADAMRIFSVLMSGSESSLPLFKALGEALSTHRGAASFEQIVLGDSLDGVGLSLQPDTLRMGAMRATVTLYDADKPEIVILGEFNPAALNMLPQNAMIVQDGADAAGAVYDLLYALPLTNFAGLILGGFPVQESAGSASGSIEEPTTDNIQQAVDGVLAALKRVADFDLQDNFLQYLSGSYAVALIPRPNNPNPLGLPYDVIVVAEVNDDEAALNGLSLLTRAVLGLDTLGSITIDDLDFQIVEVETAVEPTISMGVVDHMLVIATGSALESVLDAHQGDNQLISRPRWQAVSEESIPNLYVDIPAIYNTFFPQAGGTSLQSISQLAATTTYLGDGLYRVEVQVILPGGLG